MKRILLALVILLSLTTGYSQTPASPTNKRKVEISFDKQSSKRIEIANGQMNVGVARIDITPEGHIRLAGYGARSKDPSNGVLQRLSAKAMAFGNDRQGPSILITVDLVGIPGYITSELAERLSKKIGLDPTRLAISASHTHSGPELGTLLNILQYRGAFFSDSLLPVDQMIQISMYMDQLTPKLETVVLAALKDRRPALVAWGQGEVGFAKNRCKQPNLVDHSMPMLRVTDPNGKLRAILVNYACHGTTLYGDVNQIHGDWIGEAQRLIEAKHEGVIAMVALGCAADADPELRGKMEYTTLHGQAIASEVDSLLGTTMHPLTVPPVGRLKRIELPFAHVPDVQELVAQTADKSIKGYYARLALEQIARGQQIPSAVSSYPVQTWTFGNQLAMIFLGGEVVSEYSLRLKKELKGGRIWVNSYSNDVPCYIASQRAIHDPAYSYESEYSMYYYNKPSPLADGVEDLILKTVYDLLPASFKTTSKK